MMTNPKFVIIGMGPCGLGAAWRLQELGHHNYKVFERLAHPGGLASSFVDEKGFTWDIGGHVEFSHYHYYDSVLKTIMGDDWIYHDRSSWVWTRERFVPYPFQNNIRFLPEEEMLECLSGLIELYRSPQPAPQNFRDWIHSTFGKGIAETFMLPYNFKVWGYAPEKLSFGWIAERVAVPDLMRIVRNIVQKKDDLSWGPNNQFKFPLRGGSGEVWRRLYSRLNAERMFFNHEVEKVSTSEQRVYFKDGHKEDYDILINSMPLDQFVMLSDLQDKSAGELLTHSSTHIVGVGLKGSAPETLKHKSWMYFPEANCPFYRVTVFSNYSPNNVPDDQHWSLMAEVTESPDKKVDKDLIKAETIQGLRNVGFIQEKDVVQVWHHFEPYGYPTPGLERDRALGVLKQLDALNVYSRGRFGAWMYEVSNQDHSFMQGVEVVNRVLLNQPERTIVEPGNVNAKKS